jgi:hypothetical protein
MSAKGGGYAPPDRGSPTAPRGINKSLRELFFGKSTAPAKRALKDKVQAAELPEQSTPVLDNPYANLFFAMLALAVKDLWPEDPEYIYAGEPAWKSEIFAREWIDSDSYEPFAFNWIVEHFGLSPNDIRKAIYDAGPPLAKRIMIRLQREGRL